MISVKDVSFSYGSVKALAGISFEVPAGQTAALVGASGCGKTSLLYLLAGLLQPESGTIEIMEKLRPPGLLFQQDLLLPWKTVLNNTVIGLPSKKEMKDKAAAVLEQLKIPEQANKYPHQLSGGQRQRAALARVLVRDPGLLLLDEPTSSLDEITRERLQADLKQTVNELGITMVFVTHDVEEAVFLGRTILVMEQKGIYRRIDNSSYDLPAARREHSFFDTCCRVRSALEEAMSRER